MVKGVAEGVKAREVATEAARAKVTVEAARSGATSADMSRAACPPSRPAGRQPWFVAAAVWSELTRAGAAAKAAVCSVLSEPARSRSVNASAAACAAAAGLAGGNDWACTSRPPQMMPNEDVD